MCYNLHNLLLSNNNKVTDGLFQSKYIPVRVHETILEILLLVTLLPNCLMLLYYLRNNMCLQLRIYNLDLNKICPILIARYDGDNQSLQR